MNARLLAAAIAAALSYGLVNQPVHPAPAQAVQMKPYTETIPGTDIRFEMIPIPGGTFTMGSPESEPGRDKAEGPQHEVRVGPFWMGKFEVTWNEYDVFAFSQDIKKKKELKVDLSKQPPTEQAADAVTRPTPPYTDMTFGYGHDNYPAICMTHHAAMEYGQWLAAKTGKPYRLPTEAEWEYACRAGTKTAYSFGAEADKVGEYGWFTDNSDGQSQPVGKKKPNPWGLYDMHGNVAEWCIDHYDAGFYKTFPPGSVALAPVLLPTERRFAHVVRGGSWDDEAPGLRSAARRASTREWLRQDPQRPQSIWWLTDGIFVGLRIIRPLEEQDNLKGFRSKVTKESKY